MTNDTKLAVLETFTAGILHTLDMLACDEDGAINKSLIQATREQVEALAIASQHNEALMKSMMSAMTELKAQRDEAVDSADWRAPKQRARIKREIAGRMALATSLPAGDIERVLDLVDGSADLHVTEASAQDFIAALEALAIEAAEDAERRAG
jgi:hypothetical protein